MKKRLLEEMTQDFTEDLSLQYSLIAAKLSLSPTLPMRLLKQSTESLSNKFKRMCAMYPTEFQETLFRIAVASIAVLPGIAIVNEKYAFALALQQVAQDYQPKKPRPMILKAVA